MTMIYLPDEVNEKQKDKKFVRRKRERIRETRKEEITFQNERKRREDKERKSSSIY